MLDTILEQFGLQANDYQIIEFGSGLINHTWKVSGTKNYILQQLNSYVFKQPEAIAKNLALLEGYLKRTNPNYLFVAPLWSPSGDNLVKGGDGEYYHLFPFIDNSVTINAVEQPKQAFEAARQFGNFTFLLRDFDPQQLQVTIPNFHNLELRFNQFKDACVNATKDRMKIAADEVKEIYSNREILFIYEDIVAHKKLPERVIHHDTKISNVLFDSKGNGLCVIDLDTVMPGYYISDAGDMLRTYLSPVDEEEKDFDRIRIDKDCFYAVYNGYFSVMVDELTVAEKQYFIYSGKYMMYMQAIRFLTDFLNGDVYYHTIYPGQNLVRAQNQLTLLKRFSELEHEFQECIKTPPLI
jgi:hypothetical protein